MIVVSAVLLIIGLTGAVLGYTFSCGSETETDFKKKKALKMFGKILNTLAIAALTAMLVIPIIGPQYKVWQQNKEGEAELMRAEQNRKIAIQEAKAKEEASVSLANAEVIRAQGVAKANAIIGESLQNNDAYIHYLWIEALRESSNEVIYIPTEAGIPITESTRFFKKGDMNDQK